MTDIPAEGWILIGFFLYHLVYGLSYICSNKIASLRKKLEVVYALLFLCLVLSFAPLVGIGWIKTLCLLTGFIIFFVIIEPITKYLAHGKADRKSCYYHVFSWFGNISLLTATGLMAKSSVWFVAASVFTGQAVVNIFFELAMKKSIALLDPTEACSESMWTEDFIKQDSPTFLMWTCFIIFYPLGGKIDMDALRQLYGFIGVASMGMISIVGSGSISVANRLTTASRGTSVEGDEERHTLSQLTRGFASLCITMVFVSLFGWVRVRGPLDLQRTSLIPPIPISQRSLPSLGEILDIAMIVIIITMAIGVFLYMISLLSLFTRIRSKQV